MSVSKKVVLVGHYGVGKSSLIRRFVQNIFSDSYQVTIGVHILKKTVSYKGEDITLVLWDIEGKENINQSRASYLLGTSGFIFVIDPTRDTTYQNLKEELIFLEKNYPKVPVIKLVNKSDLINIDEFQKVLAIQNLEIDFFSSAKTGENVENVFMQLVSKMLGA
ncbi:MAG: GTP-binding protein [Sediminibacterium sp.]|nr:GTP-binding protein [Sediminibacterium sp.]MBX9780940.1 GTP-binding protein [Chitinophagaceae bacterium]